MLQQRCIFFAPIYGSLRAWKVSLHPTTQQGLNESVATSLANDSVKGNVNGLTPGR